MYGDKSGGGDRGECKKTRGEKWRHLPHVGHTADVPVADVLVKRRRLIEHGPVRRHAAHGMRKERRKEARTLRQVTIHGCAVR